MNATLYPHLLRPMSNLGDIQWPLFVRITGDVDYEEAFAPFLKREKLRLDLVEGHYGT